MTKQTRKIWTAGLLTSVAAGAIMGVVVVLIFTLFLGKGPIYPIQLIGATIYGEGALVGFHLPAFLAGLVMHMGVGVAWGVVFCVLASVLQVQTVTKAMTVGVIVAALSMLDSYLIIPYLMTYLHGVDIWNREMPIFWNWAGHIAFGLCFGLYPAIKRRLPR